MGIAEGEYEGKPNPHAWMSLENALNYVDNIRDALSEHDPANSRGLRGQCLRLTRPRSPLPSPLCAKRLAVPESSAGCFLRGRLQLLDPRLPNAGALPLAINA
jgi:manganese/iron transport system substrate-binding protein